MLTTLDTFKNETTPLQDVEDPWSTSLPESNQGILGMIACSLFLLDIVIVSLALGQLVIWCTTVAAIDAPRVMLSACDALFTTGLLVRRVPTIIG